MATLAPRWRRLGGESQESTQESDEQAPEAALETANQHVLILTPRDSEWCLHLTSPLNLLLLILLHLLLEFTLAWKEIKDRLAAPNPTSKPLNL